jgi:hypothetical protein
VLCCVLHQVSPILGDGSIGLHFSACGHGSGNCVWEMEGIEKGILAFYASLFSADDVRLWAYGRTAAYARGMHRNS